MAIRKELLDELLKDCKSSADLTGSEGLLSKLTGALVERILVSRDHGSPRLREA